MRKHTLAELDKLPTLAVGQADDLKIETADRRIWLSRCGVEDGEPYPNKVSVEEYNAVTNRWETVETYQAL